MNKVFKSSPRSELSQRFGVKVTPKGLKLPREGIFLYKAQEGLLENVEIVHKDPDRKLFLLLREFICKRYKGTNKMDQLKIILMECEWDYQNRKRGRCYDGFCKDGRHFNGF